MRPPSSSSPKLLSRVRIACRRRDYSLHTERAYVQWVRRFVRFHDTTHPRLLDAHDVRAFLNALATDLHVAASTQNQALNALVFLYDKVLDAPVGAITPAKRPRRLPTVLSRLDVRAVLNAMPAGANRLVAELLYGSGLRPFACV
jgi:site-specific recombinase XerD